MSELSFRDQAAIAVLSSMIASKPSIFYVHSYKEYASKAYAFADALIAEKDGDAPRYIDRKY